MLPDAAAMGPYLTAYLQLFRFQDRKRTHLLLSPTHEEEITSLVAQSTKSYKDLPLRLYQISMDELACFHPFVLATLANTVGKRANTATSLVHGMAFFDPGSSP